MVSIIVLQCFHLRFSSHRRRERKWIPLVCWINMFHLFIEAFCAILHWKPGILNAWVFSNYYYALVSHYLRNVSILPQKCCWPWNVKLNRKSYFTSSVSTWFVTPYSLFLITFINFIYYFLSAKEKCNSIVRSFNTMKLIQTHHGWLIKYFSKISCFSVFFFNHRIQ